MFIFVKIFETFYNNHTHFTLMANNLLLEKKINKVNKTINESANHHHHVIIITFIIEWYVIALLHNWRPERPMTSRGERYLLREHSWITKHTQVHTPYAYFSQGKVYSSLDSVTCSIKNRVDVAESRNSTCSPRELSLYNTNSIYDTRPTSDLA